MDAACQSCSSFVPIVETERQPRVKERHAFLFVAAHSFRLWKLKAFKTFGIDDQVTELQLIRSDCGN